jgi:hypothetical protein
MTEAGDWKNKFFPHRSSEFLSSLVASDPCFKFIVIILISSKIFLGNILVIWSARYEVVQRCATLAKFFAICGTNSSK